MLDVNATKHGGTDAADTNGTLLKRISIDTGKYIEVVEIWWFPDGYYAMNTHIADCSFSGTLEDVRKEFKKYFSMDLIL